ncbi:MAG: hypothetical protein JO246_00430 [Frankiaceae bacterium]|nr:hypothetical protein [Frankiaceae bacterium]MBV9870887.1 hypothetical protein [Frankiaceae bacterium]
MTQAFRPELLEVAAQYAVQLQGQATATATRSPRRRVRTAIGRSLVRIGERLVTPPRAVLGR